MNHMRIEDDETAGRQLGQPLHIHIETRRIGKERSQACSIIQSGKKAISMASGNDSKTTVASIRVIERDHDVRQLITMVAGMTPIG